jgi:hypothetical protein
MPVMPFATLSTRQDDDDEGEGEEEAVQWYKRSGVWFRIAAFTLSALLLVVGVLTHNVEGMKAVNNSGVQLFRWDLTWQLLMQQCCCVYMAFWL